MLALEAQRGQPGESAIDQIEKALAKFQETKTTIS